MAKQSKTVDIGPNITKILVVLLVILSGLDITTLLGMWGPRCVISVSVTVILRRFDSMTTQKAIFSYEEVIDLHTESNRVSVIGIHTPTGDTPRKLCPGFFEQFKKYKYLGCSVALVPAATLPADPLSVSYEAGEPTIDPRDMLNPILFHGCHGNDMGNILNRLYSSGLADSSDFSQVLHSDSIDLADMWNIQSESDDVPSLQILESLYYRALTDKTWKKANIQRGFRKTGLRPRIYSLATNMQLMGQTTLGTQRAPGIIEGTLDLSTPLDPEFDLEDPVVNPVRYFTPRTVQLGWLDTRQVVPYVAEGEISNVDVNDLPETIAGLVTGKTVWNELPEIYMGMILLPPAYKTEMYFRMVVNHHFAFAGFRGISLSNDMIEMPPNYDNWNDALSTHQDPPEPDPPIGGRAILMDSISKGAPNLNPSGISPIAMNNYEGVSLDMGQTTLKPLKMTISGGIGDYGCSLIIAQGSSPGENLVGYFGSHPSYPSSPFIAYNGVFYEFNSTLGMYTTTTKTYTVDWGEDISGTDLALIGTSTPLPEVQEES